MPNAIDAVAVNTSPVTPNSQPVVAQPAGGDVVPMRRGGAVGGSGYTTGPVAGMGIDPSAFSRTPTSTPAPAPAPAPAPVEPAPAVEKPGFFKRIGRALNPATWAKKIADKSKGLARAIGWGGTAAAGAGTVATGALVANHFAPVAVHGALKSLGMLGLLGPHGAALGGAVVAGALTLGAIGIARSFLRAGKKEKAVEPKSPDSPEEPKADDKKKPSFFRRAVAGVLNTLGIGGGLAVGGYGLFQAGTAMMGGAAVAAVAPMLLVPLGAVLVGGLVVAAGKAIKGGDK